MESFGGRFCCALLLAVLCLAPLATGMAFGKTHHFALSVQQAKVIALGSVPSCFLVQHGQPSQWKRLPASCELPAALAKTRQ